MTRRKNHSTKDEPISNAVNIPKDSNELELTDLRSIYSTSKFSNLYSSASTIDAESSRSVGNRQTNENFLGGDNYWREAVTRSDRLMAVRESEAEEQGKWVSPVDANNKRWGHVDRSSGRPRGAPAGDPIAKCLDSSFDLNASMISLDFGLISPKRNWSSPPQRIERAQNWEWSPHRVIDRPNPENSPGNWISVKVSCQESPPPPPPPLPPFTTDIKHVAGVAEDFAHRPEGEPRSSSQCTYVVPEKVSISALPRPESQQIPARKTCVLMDYVPDRGGGGDGVQPRKRVAGSSEPVSSVGQPVSSDKVKRVVDAGGRVVKISQLNDYQVTASGGKFHEKIGDHGEKNGIPGEPPSKTVKKNSNPKPGKKENTMTTKTAKLLTTIPAKKEISSENTHKARIDQKEDAIDQMESTDAPIQKLDTQEEANKNVELNTKKIITDLENILRDKSSMSPEKDKEKKESVSMRKSLPTKFTTEEIQQPIPEKRKRNIDTKGVQEYIRNQKQKRVEQIKESKQTKVKEKEAIKKNLEELRVKTLKLAMAKPKKKKLPTKTIKIIDPGTEDDITMSLGLRQIKPKVSYNESVLNLKKKTPRPKAEGNSVESHQVELVCFEKKDEKQDEGEEEEVKDDEEKVLQQEGQQQQEEQDLEKSMSVVVEPLARPTVDSTKLNIRKTNDLNATLKKLAEALHLKMSEGKTGQMNFKSKTAVSKASKDSSLSVKSQESIESTDVVSKDKRQMVTIDLDTIYSLKEDIRKISENFKVLHEIIAEKADLSERNKEKKNDEVVQKEPQKMRTVRGKSENDFPFWLDGPLPGPHPYSVYTAFRRKMNLETTESSLLSVTSQETSSYAETISNKPDSDFEPLSLPSDRLQPPSAHQIVQGVSKKSSKTTRDAAKENYFSYKDSGSELSSSIWDSDKQISMSLGTERKRTFSSVHSSTVESKPPNNTTRSTVTSSSIITEIRSKNIPPTSYRESFISPVNLSNEKDNLILTTPDVKLISNDFAEMKLNDCNREMNFASEPSVQQVLKNNVPSDCLVKHSSRDSETDSTITEAIDSQSALSGNRRSDVLVRMGGKKVQNLVQRVNGAQQIRRTFFQPEMLHLQFQAELTLLETFQQSLSHFLEAERMKTLSEVTKIVYEKSVNTEKLLEREDQAVQTTFVEDQSIKTEKNLTEEEDTESVTTDIEISEEESIKSVKTVSSCYEANNVSEKKTSEISEKISESKNQCDRKDDSREKSAGNDHSGRKEVETPDFSNGNNGISFQMLERLIKDEELRSEHQLALIRLREKTLNEKVKAELTFLEMKKRALKEGGNDEDQNVSAIKKRQRGILLKYQSEKEEIERLKKMHKIASEERKIMIEQQKQIQQMQLSTKYMLTKLWRKEKSPQKKSTLKSKVSISYDSQSDIEEDIPVMSDSILTESVGSVRESSKNSKDSDLEISSGYNASDAESDVVAKLKKPTQTEVSGAVSSRKSKKSSAMEPERYPKIRHSVDELLSWTKRLEEKENRLRELERKAIGTGMASGKNRLKSLKSVKRYMKDRSTSPFQFPESLISPTENSSSIGEAIEAKNSSVITEAIPESIYETEITKKTETLPATVSEDIPAQFSKTGSRTLEYYSESFESPSSSETAKAKALGLRSKTPIKSEGSYKSIPIKLSLSPRIQSPRRRNSSGSDDSQNFSHTETASEQSDLESRIAALHEQLKKRKLEAERLRREQKKAQRERLKVKEQSLLKQIQAYDAYIQKKKQELEQEYDHSCQTISKPLIKQPKVAEKSSLKRPDSVQHNETDKIKIYPKVPTTTEKEKESFVSRKAPESDSEIQEQIKEESEKTSISEKQSSSLTEQIECKADDIEEEMEDEEEIEEVRKTTASELTEAKEITCAVEEESSLNEASDILKGNSASIQSEPEAEIDIEGSMSESEGQSTSIKTTVHSPGKQDTDALESKGKTIVTEEDSKSNLASSIENTYLSDTFESDYDDKSPTKTPKESVASEVLTDLSGSAIPSTTAKEDVESESRKLLSEDVKDEFNVSREKSIASDISDVKSTSFEEETTEPANMMANAVVISNSIILDLLAESLKVFSNRELKIQNKLKEEFKVSREVLASVLAKGIIAETIDDMLKIYNRKMSASEEKAATTKYDDEKDEEPISPEKITSDIRKRICEIMSQAGGLKDQRRPQDMMVTTYDVTPSESPPPEEANKSDIDEREEFFRSLTSTSKENRSLEVFLPGESVQQDNKNDIFGQEWFDNDFGLSRTRREAEQLRLQQIQIEQEIQQLKAQQEQIPYYYLREIPNKPPPPYTPPGKPFSEIPTSESDILNVTSMAVDILSRELKEGKWPSDLEPGRDFFGTATSDHVKGYKTFLFDLARHLIEQVVRIQDRRKEKVLPWNKVREPLSVYKYSQIERNGKGLNEYVRKQVLVLFGFGGKIERESLMMRCFKKKRDHVDEILVCESQEEESRWTQFDEDQVAVKNEVALAILDGLLLESAQLFNVIFNKKIKSSNR